MSEPQTKIIHSRSSEDGLKSREWRISYKTSSTLINNQPVNMLHDFYIPALNLSNRYDRVAGYFRSSSLAAASQGFSAFVGKGGKMRLIVGADLQPEDVQAVLEGDQQRLAKQLNDQITIKSSWPDKVRNGVELLAWMVANDYLEVKVAFRVHGDTGHPLTWDATEDGYVHEKWFILQDQLGNRLYGSGTLNESKTALILNAENIDIHCDWWSEIDRRRVDEATVAFEKLWNSEIPHMPVYGMPEAVHQKLIKIADKVTKPVEVDGSCANKVKAIKPSPQEILQFAVIRDAPKMPGGRFVGMYTAPVEPWPHQEIVAQRLVETWPYTYLLCDEVGLGKTIEAGLAFRSLYLSGLVNRILITVPASLTEQWHRQMASKLLLPFALTMSGPSEKHKYIFPDEAEVKNSSIYEPDLVIISTGLLTRRERQNALKAAEPFDIALVDEAHAARRKNPAKGASGNPIFGQLYILLREQLRNKAKSLWLTTATPMQIDPVEACDLLALTNRVGAFQYDPTLTLAYYDLVAKIIHKAPLHKYEWDFLGKSLSSLKNQDPLLWQFIQDNVIDSRLRITVKHWLEANNPILRDQGLLGRLIFSVSPLSRVMLRHSRRLLEIYRENGQLKENLPKREILALPRIMFNSLEKEIYDKLEVYCKGLNQQIQKYGDNQTRNAVGFLLSFLRLRFASSLYALRETLSRRLLKVKATLKAQFSEEETWVDGTDYSLEDLIYEEEMEDDLIAVESLLKKRTTADLIWEKEHLVDLLDSLSDISGPSSKMIELLKALDKRLIGQEKRIQQTVIFTRFFDTLTDIVKRLRQAKPGVLIGTYSGRGGQIYDSIQGKMLNVKRDEVKERFLRGELELLICTDAAAEGLNLQTADLLINYDLGWNPMKVEQRIGRIDRIGQKHRKVYVYNLCYINSAEEIVYGRLLKRLSAANLIVGTQQFSLLPVTPEDFQQLAEAKMSPEALYIKAKKRIELQRKRSESMEMPPHELYDTYMRMAKSKKNKTPPISLSEIWKAITGSEYLLALGLEVCSYEKNEEVAKITGINGVKPNTMLTISRKIYEEGIAEAKENLNFASHGDPIFEAILDYMAKYELPNCVKRITVQVSDLKGVEVVGYAASCYTVNGSRITKLITRWGDLEELKLAVDEELNEYEVEQLKTQLVTLARKEFGHYGAAKRVEVDNKRAALSQELLNCLVIKSLVENRAKLAGSNALFWSVIEDIDQLFRDRDQVQVDVTPAEYLRPFTSDLLFNIDLVTASDQAFVETTKILGKSASDTARRQAESMKKRKKELSADLILARMKREVEAKNDQLKKIQR